MNIEQYSLHKYQGHGRDRRDRRLLYDEYTRKKKSIRQVLLRYYETLKNKNLVMIFQCHLIPNKTHMIKLNR